MRGVNPFLLMPTLMTFVRSVARELDQGRRVLAVTGPYEAQQFRRAVASVMRASALSDDQTRVVERTDLVRTIDGVGGVRLVVARSLHLPSARLTREGCEGWYGSIAICPSGVTRTELRTFAFSLIADTGLTSAFRTMVVDYACELCAGNVASLRAALEICLRAKYRPPHAFVAPRVIAAELAELQSRRAWQRSVALGLAPAPPTDPDESAPLVRSFRRQLMRSLEATDRLQGASDPRDRSARLSWMWEWAWSQGLCARVDGAWCPGWDVLMVGSRPWEPEDDPAVEAEDVCRASLVFADVVKCRTVAAMQMAFGPVWERYKSHAVARLIDAADDPLADEELGRYEFNGDSCLIKRSDDMLHVAHFASTAGPAWAKANGRRVSFGAVRELRNYVSHGQPERVEERQLAALGLMLDELGACEQRPDSPLYRRCFC